jgi:hypothetical protein
MAANDTYSFGSGSLWTTQLTDYTGATVTLPTPLLIGTLQDVSVDFAWDAKPLHGQNMAAVAMGRGKLKIEAKAKFARLDGNLFQSVIVGQPITTALAGITYDTTGALIPTTPYTITPIVPSSGTWSRPLAVRDGLGNAYTQVASAPTTGQFSVTAGAYLFAAADTGKTVYIDYVYTATSTTAKTAVVVNAPMGAAPTMKVDLINPRSGMTLALYAAMVVKFSFASKQDDWTINEIDLMAFADSNNNVFKFGTIA